MKNQHTRAFTLIELLVVLAIASILITLAAPSFRDFYRSSQLSSQVNTLIAALHTAKNEAIKNNLYSYLVPNDGSSWESGWTIFVDTDFDQDFTDGTDIKVMQSDGLPASISIEATGSAGSASPYVSFDGSGYPRENNNSPESLTFTLKIKGLSDADALQNTRHVIMAMTGRIRSCKPASLNDDSCKSTSTE